MKSRVHRAKSTKEFVYKKVTKVAGRDQYKLVEAPTHREEGTSGNRVEVSFQNKVVEPVVETPRQQPREDGYSNEGWMDDNDMEQKNPRRQGKKQSDYMRQWVTEKRTDYLLRILQDKQGPENESGIPMKCSNCEVGRARWRCSDCLDRRPFCVLCFRSSHQKHPFHRVEKWNGRYYQRGALWQVGVKIFTGHGGNPCPKTVGTSTAAEAKERGYSVEKSGSKGRLYPPAIPAVKASTAEVQGGGHTVGDEGGPRSYAGRTDPPHDSAVKFSHFLTPEEQVDSGGRRFREAAEETFESGMFEDPGPPAAFLDNDYGARLDKVPYAHKSADIGRRSPTRLRSSEWEPVIEDPNWRSEILYAVSMAEKEADDIQTAADRAMAESETECHISPVFEAATADIPISDGHVGNDDHWEDEDPRTKKEHVPRFLPIPPPTDMLGNSFITVVHTNGFHQLPIIWCSCAEHQDDRDLQLLDLHLYPASYDRIQTVFTFACLDDQRLDNVECKSSHYQYHRKLRRLTCPEYPECAPNRYAELRRVSRQWRNLKYRKWFWCIEEAQPKKGQMALFCPACPQPGINLPPGWEAEFAENPSLYLRSFVADGNFKADHLKQKHDDVWLTDGEAFMTNTAAYNEHLRVAHESRNKPTCHRHRAQLNGETPHNSADCSGLGGHCCARHGFLAPSSLVNFQKGEKQMNMDWSLCEALATTNIGPLTHVLHIYDINCQYCQYLLQRIAENPYLHIPDHIQLHHAIGLFHVHGHKDECLYRWATSYVPGAGIVDGEILETLWAVLNTVSASTQTASLAHRTEILDDHMNESNFKKLLNIVKSLIARYNRALENIDDARTSFQMLNEGAPPEQKAIWEESIEEAERLRSTKPSAMDIMHSRIKAGATLKEITADLMRKDGLSIGDIPDDGTATQWLLEGLNIEDEQIRIRQQVRANGKNPTVDQTLNVERKRQHIAARIRDFHTTSERLLGIEQVLGKIGTSDTMDPDGYVSDDLRPTEGRYTADLTEIENTAIVFPSTVGAQNEAKADLRRRELHLRRAKANDHLAHVRECLSGLSYQYINKVRQSITTKENLRAFQGIRLLTQEVSFHRQVYNRNRRALALLAPELGPRFPYLCRSECTISTAIADVNAPGQSQNRMSWIWGATDGYDPETAQRIGTDSDRLLEFYRVNWLRARAQKNRWEEELPRTEREMLWTLCYFVHEQNAWTERLLKVRKLPKPCLGQIAYFERKISQWEEMARAAKFQFRLVNPDIPSSWQNTRILC